MAPSTPFTWKNHPLTRKSLVLPSLYIAPTSRPPAVLQVNKEAREEGLRLNKPHQLRFRVSDPGDAKTDRILYFNPSDVLYLCSTIFHVGDPRNPWCKIGAIDDVSSAVSSLIESLPEEQLDKVHFLALDVPRANSVDSPTCFLKQISKFNNLKSVFFVLDGGRNFKEEDTFIDPPLSLVKDCLTRHMEIRTIFNRGWNDRKQARPDWHVVSLERDPSQGDLETLGKSVSMTVDFVMRLSR